MTEKADRRRIVAEAVKAKARRDLFIRDMLARPDGREYFWWLLEIGKVGANPMAQTPELTAFGCGELNVGQQIYASVLEADPAGYLRMQQERNDAGREQHSDTGESPTEFGDSTEPEPTAG